MNLTQAEKEQLESVGIQCIRVMDIPSITTEYPSRGKSMLGVKSDRDVSYFEKQYLISKGWNPELF